ncbi:MAG: tetratricopeptide repeat protein [Phycisphaerae bacterium]
MKSERCHESAAVRLAAASLVLLFAAVTAWAPRAVSADTPASAPAVTPEQIAQAIKDLGSGTWKTREKAMETLWEAGPAAKAALEEAARGSDAEVTSRAKLLLDRLRYGIRPDTPKEVTDLIDQYRRGEAGEKVTALRALLELGPKAYKTVAGLISGETDADLRAMLGGVVRQMANVTPAMLAAGEFEKAESLWAMAVECGEELSIRNYAAYLLCRGMIDDKIKSVGDKPTESQARLLAFLCRAKGDLASALAAAKKSGDDVLVGNILFEMGDWKALAKLQQDSRPDEIESLAYLASYQRLSGDIAGMEATLQKVLNRGPVVPFDKNGRRDDDAGSLSWSATRVLLLNDRPKQAIERLIKEKGYDDPYNLLLAQGKVDDAIDLAKDARENGSRQIADEMDRALALLYWRLGEKDKAKAIVAGQFDKWKKLGEGRAPEPTPEEDGEADIASPAARAAQREALLDGVVRLEVEFELADDAWRHAAGCMTINDEPPRILDALVGDRDGEAAAWWRILWKDNNKDAAKCFKALRQIMDGKIARDDLAALAKKAKDVEFLQGPIGPGPGPAAGPRNRNRSIENRLYLGLAQTLEKAGQTDLAMELLAPAVDVDDYPDFDAIVWMGDVYGRRKKWKEAADLLAKAVGKTGPRASPVELGPASLLVFLQGYALTQAGDEKEGNRLMDQADLMAMANEGQRYLLAEAMERRGLKDQARRQWDMVRRVGAFRSVYLERPLMRGYDDAMKAKDYTAARTFAERYRVASQAEGVMMLNVAGYLQLMRMSHVPLVKAYLAEKKLDQVAAEVDLCLAAMPGDIEIAIELTADMEKAGAKDQADRLFERIWDVCDRVCTKYPNSAEYHNNLAWMGARCRRNLDAALKLAQKAVELDRRTAYLDTLAEVCFQKGDRDKAIELMKECIDLHAKESAKAPPKPVENAPDKMGDYLRSQLERFKAGDPSTDPKQ